MTLLADRKITVYDPTEVDDSPGRRMRVFACLIAKHANSDRIFTRQMDDFHIPWVDVDGEIPTYQELYKYVNTTSFLRNKFVEVPVVNRNIREIQFDAARMRQLAATARGSHAQDPELCLALQDVADEINEDIREACYAFNDPNLYYPGVDEGIEPVPDSHVELVIPALQRELNRELRPPNNDYDKAKLPAPPLDTLPWHIQRALVERRRLRYMQWGITREVWQNNRFSLWDVPEDSEWIPRRAARLLQTA